MTSPVTHTSQVAVNTAVTAGAARPLSVAIGNASNAEPTSTARANPTTTSRAGCPTASANAAVTQRGNRIRQAVFANAATSSASCPRSHRPGAGRRAAVHWEPATRVQARHREALHGRHQHEQAEQQLNPR